MIGLELDQVTWSSSITQRPVSRSSDHSQPIRGQYEGHVTTLYQSEAREKDKFPSCFQFSLVWKDLIIIFPAHISNSPSLVWLMSYLNSISKFWSRREKKEREREARLVVEYFRQLIHLNIFRILTFWSVTLVSFINQWEAIT